MAVTRFIYKWDPNIVLVSFRDTGLVTTHWFDVVLVTKFDMKFSNHTMV